MSAEQNKEMVKATWTAFGKGDIKTAFAQHGRQRELADSGEHPGDLGRQARQR